MPKSPTQPSTPRLSELAQRVAVPKGMVSTGWPAVVDKCDELGISFRPWQVGAGQVILAKRKDGKYAATIGGTGMSIPRQVGKTFLVGAIIFALCLLRPKLTVIWTAHRLRTAEETFGKMQAFAKRKGIAPHILKIVLGSGDEAIIFRNGSRILFGARERGFGRGFDEVDALIFDEAQILTDNALDDMIPATNQCRQETGALMLFMGTPPKPTDPSEVFRRMRSETLTGEDDDTGWIEFGADEGFVPTPSPAHLKPEDWEQVAKANPSFPEDTPREAILRMRKKLGPESFSREGLGIWDGRSKPLIMPAWPNCSVRREAAPIPAALGVAVDIDRVWASCGVVSVGPTPHLAPMSSAKAGRVLRVRLADPQFGKAEFVAEVARIAIENNIPVGLDNKGPAGDLSSALVAAGAIVLPGSLDDYVTACTDIYDSVEAKEVEHSDYDDLDKAVAAAGWRYVHREGGRKVWSRVSGDISMLEAVTWAKWAANSPPTEAWGFFS
jgi:hypothetical protein